MLDARSMRTPLALLAVALMSSLGGCTSSGDSVSATCSEYIDALRAYNERCSSGGSSSIRWAEVQARYKASCDAALGLPGTGLNGTYIHRCAEAMKTASCTGLGGVPECSSPPGTLADGNRCTDSAQCTSTYCKVSDPSGCGVCSATVAAGGACTGGERCAKGTSCVSGTCTTVTYGNAGAACDYGKAQLCANGLICDGTSKTCKLPPGVGEPCPSGYCASGLSCDYAGTKTCYAPAVVGAGQACGGTSKAVCQSGLVCKSNVCAIITYLDPGGDCSVTGTVCKRGSCLSTTRTCPKIIPDGGACTVGKSEDGICDEAANCFNGKCVLNGTNKCL